ncbi:MAG: MerR family transcriptional regulator [Betaproteobacteria bacterium]|jgi:DNA-binding transcriptional MerR regulator|nr:MerR family transcriptional regulator [Betaproteobacteria bacterium]
MNKNYLPNTPLHKIGAVSSLSGVPTPTLRVWEVRYATFTPLKTQGQHRLYSDDDVLKATLLKRLTEQGHAISNIANLSSQALNNLLMQQQSSNRIQVHRQLEDRSISMAIVGLALAGRIESKKFTLSFNNHEIKVTDIFNDLSDALGAEFEQPTQILLIKTNSLHAGIEVDIHKLAQKCQALQVIVLYNYGQQNIIESMKFSGMIVRREPISDSDLADLINSVLLVGTEQKNSGFVVGAVIPQRKYSDATLAKVAAISSNVLCECPRHVAEIIAQLASFEQYTHECLNKSTEDAHLHAYLSSVSGSARALFESALEMVAKHEGIELVP